jgi:Type II secretion system (T2SS), protein E, N-terminal domain
VSSYDHFPHIPRTRDGSPNWAADTDPVGPVTPELALVDPDLARGEIHDDEVTMSSMQFGEPQGPVEGQPAVPLQPLQPLVVAPATPEATPPLPPPAPAPVEPVAAPAEPAPAVPVNDMRDVPLGTLVFRAGLLPEEQLEEALQEGMKTGKRLGEILLERGLVSETDLGRLLAAQKGLPFVELDPSALDPTAPPLFPAEKARLHGALPVGFEGGVPVVAVADPTNDLVVENVRRALACEPVLVVAGRDALMRAIDYAYDNSAPAQPAPAPQPVAVDPVPVQPVAAPVVDPLASPVVEPLAAPVVEPPAVPVAEPQPAPVVVAEPFVPVVPEPAAPTAPVAPPPVVDPVAPVQPAPNGDGIWLGQPQEAQAQQFTPAEPVAPAPEPVPVAPVVQAPVEPVVAPEPELVVEPAAVVEPTPDPVEELTWSVVLRLADGDRVEVGSFPGEEAAVEGAKAVVAQIAAEGSWPFFAGRFIRPEGIVSVDLVELEVSKWLGSSARAAALPPEQYPTT